MKEQTLWKVPRQGGAAQEICEIPGGVDDIRGGGGASWRRGGSIVFSVPQGAIYEVSDRGGDARLAYEPDAANGELDFHNPSALPGDKGVLTAVHTTGGIDTLAVISEHGQRVIVSAPGQRFSRPAYSPTGHVVYERIGSNAGIWAVPFDLDELQATGEPFLVAADGRQPSVSGDGTLVYLAGDEPEEWQLVWVDRAGNESAPVGGPHRYGQDLRLSPEGRRVAVSVNEGSLKSVWIVDLRTGNETRLTYDGMDEVESWFSGGDRLLYRRLHSTRDLPSSSASSTEARNADESEIFAKAANGSGEDVPMARNARSTRVSSDGRYLVFDRPNLAATGEGTRPVGPRTLWVDDLEDAEAARPFPSNHAGARFPVLSPDDRWVLYTTAGTSRDEIYATRFPSGEGKWQVSSGGGNWAAWSPVGGEIFYLTPEGDLMAVSVQASEDALALGAPRKLFHRGRKRPDYEVAPDGARFLFAAPVAESEPTQIRVVQNWTAEF